MTIQLIPGSFFCVAVAGESQSDHAANLQDIKEFNPNNAARAVKTGKLRNLHTVADQKKSIDDFTSDHFEITVANVNNSWYF